MSPRQSSLALSVEQVSRTGEAPTNPSPLIVADTSLFAAVGDSWCFPGGSSVCLSWWFATHHDSVNWNISASTAWTETHVTPPRTLSHWCQLLPEALQRSRHVCSRDIDLEVCVNYLQETSADGAQLKMRGNTSSLTRITGPLGCRVSYFHTNNQIFGFTT